PGADEARAAVGDIAARDAQGLPEHAREGEGAAVRQTAGEHRVLRDGERALVIDLRVQEEGVASLRGDRAVRRVGQRAADGERLLTAALAVADRVDLPVVDEVL